MADYELLFPKYKYDPNNYEEPSGPAFAGAPVPAPQGFSAVPQQDVAAAPAPMANYGEAPAQPFTIDTNVPVQPQQAPLENLYAQKFGHAPSEASVGVSDTPRAPVQPQPAPQQPAQGLSLDDSLAIAGASQGGIHQDPRAVAEVQRLRGERNDIYADQIGSVTQNANESADAQSQIGKELESRARWAEQWAADESRRQAQAAEDGKRYRADIQQKQTEATEAAANLDGNRLMHGGTGVLMTIGMALGAFGASIAKTPNFAVTIVQNALDRDLESQKENVRGKREAVSFARDIYDGFRAAGRDELESKMATRAVMFEAYATKIDAMSAQKKSGQERAAGEQASNELRMAANSEALGAAQLAAKPRGTKALTPQQIAENALKLQGQSLDNATKANKLQDGGDNKAGPAAQESIQKDLEGLKVTGTLHADAKDWQSQGYSNLPGQGGVQDIPHDITKSVKKVFGGSGETPLEARLRVGPKALGNQIFRANTGQSANTPKEQEDALAAGAGNGTTSGFIELTKKQAEAQIANIQARIDQLPPNSRERRTSQAQLDLEKAKFSGVDPNAYREKFGSKK
jgi:hypothetical protein